MLMKPSDPFAAAFLDLALDYENTVDAELHKFWGLSYPVLVRDLLECAQIRETEAVLDLATGSGLIPRTIRQKGNHSGRVVGLDMTYPVLESGMKISTAIDLVCGSAVFLPFERDTFDWVICALASHHIDQAQLLAQVHAVLKPGGRFLLADVAASPAWQLPGVKLLLRFAAYAYFLVKESPSRAWIEADAVSHVYTAAQWAVCLEKLGFTSIRTRPLAVQKTWSPSGMFMIARKIWP